MGFDQIMQKYVIDTAVLVWNTDQAGKLSWHCHHAEIGCARLGITTQLECHAQSLVKDVREGMRGINRHRRQDRVYLAGEEQVHCVVAGAVEIQPPTRFVCPRAAVREEAAGSSNRIAPPETREVLWRDAGVVLQAIVRRDQ